VQQHIPATGAALLGLLALASVAVLSNPEADLVGAPGAPPLTLITVVAAVVVALASSLVPAIRAARMSTVSALDDTPHLPSRRESPIRLSRKLPVPALFGLRLIARRPRRAVLSAASIAVAVMGLVAALAVHAGVDGKLARFGRSAGAAQDRLPAHVPGARPGRRGVPR
jgi:putative ABC transport system permease protein